VIAANAGEVQEAQLAKDRAQARQVKKYAELMTTDHGQAGRDTQRLVAKHKITPQQSPTSQRLASDSKQVVEQLKGEKGAQFDKDYIDAQVREHRELLDMLDNHLIPQVKNPEMKNELQGMRAKVQAHFSEAEDIQRNMTVKP
jgi:predicted outer membrane protein